ncbi:MAG: hypothetical protein M0013_01355, partial [Actinomycetota bacterium]|nr:hypothetical protein [Actinomycetota bacterium]
VVRPPRDMPTTAWACGASWRTTAATSFALARRSNGPSAASSEKSCLDGRPTTDELLNAYQRIEPIT